MIYIYIYIYIHIYTHTTYIISISEIVSIYVNICAIAYSPMIYIYPDLYDILSATALCGTTDLYIYMIYMIYIYMIYTHILGSVPVLRRTARAACGKPRESAGPWGCSSMSYHGDFPPSCEMTAGYPFLEDVFWDT